MKSEPVIGSAGRVDRRVAGGEERLRCATFSAVGTRLRYATARQAGRPPKVRVRDAIAVIACSSQ
jgi:hypothetical protein